MSDEIESEDDRDMPVCWWPAPVEFRPVAGWPRYRVGSDHSVWVARTRPGPSAYGWDHGPDGEALPNPREQEAIALIGRLHGEGWALRRIARELDRQGYPTRRGARHWCHHLVWVLSHRDPSPPELSWAPLRGPSITLWSGGVRRRRSAELLFRAAFHPPELGPAELPLPSVPAGLPAPYVAPLALALGQVNPAPIALALDQVDDDESPGFRKGSQHGRAKLDEEQVAEARRLRAEGWTERKLAARYGVSRSGIHYALRAETWSHVPTDAEAK